MNLDGRMIARGTVIDGSNEGPNGSFLSGVMVGIVTNYHPRLRQSSDHTEPFLITETSDVYLV